MTASENAALVSVLVPISGAPKEIIELYTAVHDEFERQGRSFEILFLINRTKSATEVLRQLQKDDSERVRVLEFEYAVGEAAMLRAGADAANGDLLLTIPCPLEVEAAAIEALFARLDAGADMAIATRMFTDAYRSAVVQSRLFNRLISFAAGLRVQDVASGTRLLRRKVLEEIPLYGDFHRYLPILAERTGFRVEEVPSAPNPQTHRAAIYAPLMYLWRLIDVITVLFISRFTRRPLRLFGSLGSIFLALGVPMMTMVGVQRMLGTPLGNRPILVLATLLIGLGVQAFTIGLLGELLLFFNARSFRDYRVAEIWEPELPLEPPPDENQEKITS